MASLNPPATALLPSPTTSSMAAPSVTSVPPDLSAAPEPTTATEASGEFVTHVSPSDADSEAARLLAGRALELDTAQSRDLPSAAVCTGPRRTPKSLHIPEPDPPQSRPPSAARSEAASMSSDSETGVGPSVFLRGAKEAYEGGHFHDRLTADMLYHELAKLALLRRSRERRMGTDDVGRFSGERARVEHRGMCKGAGARGRDSEVRSKRPHTWHSASLRSEGSNALGDQLGDLELGGSPPRAQTASTRTEIAKTVAVHDAVSPADAILAALEVSCEYDTAEATRSRSDRLQMRSAQRAST
ncbi:uncharacterized protein TRAVEDRAFT_54552 [Trametes versicolor FP-101664 SS1]|uniref:Uncharacterized protein n=1 Tax=Trametes versicolor (strain FP-101664) TaxID=717944 RepID=R7S789_TRAVS|nr:uncharacterized protein TRAVEDRAFT_54552 [Trametes versicolor FP-101664 SS1]EIW51462.1 hypothetical protein TRAVEDRAFT_54552 [Trametes versicolor FP-101664 SS1]